MSKDKKPKYSDTFSETRLSPEEYDIIHTAGYEECLRDMLKSLRNMQEILETTEAEPMDYLQGLITAAEDALNEESDTIN